jgi:hypothetical protein
MKNLFILIILSAFAVACTAPVPSPAEERNIGFHPNPDADIKDTGWYLGTQEAIEVVLQLDSVWKNNDYAALQSFFSDTARITFSNGKQFTNSEDFINTLKEWENPNSSWEMTGIYSLDISPNVGGEHVQARVTYHNVDSLGVETTSYGIESYYVIDGKVVWMDQFGQKAPQE